MAVEFESDFRSKVLHIRFSEPEILAKSRDVLSWRSLWTQELKSWHSPYKALIDCRNLEIHETESGEIQKALDTMYAFLKGFFLKKAVAFGYDNKKGHDSLPFEMCGTEEDARSKVGLDKKAAHREGDSIRSQIVLDNHFRQHVVEMACSSPVELNTADNLRQMADKLTNNLMQWHSSWSLLIDCSKLTISPALHPDFQRLETKLKGFFLKKIVGYSPASKEQTYPFRVYRARHRAAAELEGEGLFSGQDADCQSRKQGGQKTPVS